MAFNNLTLTQNCHWMVESEIVNIQDSDSIKDDLGKILEKSDNIARTAKMRIILITTISIIMVIVMAAFIVRSLQFQSESGSVERIK